MVRVNNDNKQREKEGGRRNGRRRLKGKKEDQSKEEARHSNKFVSEAAKPPRMRPLHVIHFQAPQEREQCLQVFIRSDRIWYKSERCKGVDVQVMSLDERPFEVKDALRHGG